MKEKRCPACGETKPLDEFRIMSKARDGHTPRCRACYKAGKSGTLYTKQCYRCGKDVLSTSCHASRVHCPECRKAVKAEHNKRTIAGQKRKRMAVRMGVEALELAGCDFCLFVKVCPKYIWDWRFDLPCCPDSPLHDKYQVQFEEEAWTTPQPELQPALLESAT